MNLSSCDGSTPSLIGENNLLCFFAADGMGIVVCEKPFGNYFQ